VIWSYCWGIYRSAVEWIYSPNDFFCFLVESWQCTGTRKRDVTLLFSVTLRFSLQRQARSSTIASATGAWRGGGSAKKSAFKKGETVQEVYAGSDARWVKRTLESSSMDLFVSEKSRLALLRRSRWSLLHALQVIDVFYSSRRDASSWRGMVTAVSRPVVPNPGPWITWYLAKITKCILVVKCVQPYLVVQTGNFIQAVGN